MNIIFRGLVSYSISIERTVPLANTLVRVYRVKRPNLQTTPENSSLTVSGKEIDDKVSRLLGEAYTAANGTYEIACRKPEYDGGLVEIEMHLSK